MTTSSLTNRRFSDCLRRRHYLARLFNFNQHERDRWVISRAMAVAEGSRVLDLGAGAGPYRSLLSHCRYVALDYGKNPPNNLCFAPRYTPLDILGDAQSLPLAAGAFDVVLCTEVLEHVFEPLAVVREAARVLRPGGRLILTAPLGSGLHQEPYHFYGGFTPYWYRRALQEFGFADVTVVPNGGFFKLYGQESIRWCRLSAPWKYIRPTWLGWLALPLWCLAAMWFAGICPLLCHILDHFDTDRAFTVGYHVTAVRCAEPAAGPDVSGQIDVVECAY